MTDHEDHNGELSSQHKLPAAIWNLDFARRALDELFRNARVYKTSKEYRELIEFVGRFRFYSPYNAMLIHVQMPGAQYVAPAYRWINTYGRRIRPGARPLVVLQPMGPVMFVFDVSDTEPEPNAPPLPPEIEHPFEVRKGNVGDKLEQTIENAKRDGVRCALGVAGSQNAGEIRPAQGNAFVQMITKRHPELEFASLQVRYELIFNSQHSAEVRYATIAHELGHLYCGHLGTPNPKWWPDRKGLSRTLCEIEAESVCFISCCRLGIDNPSARYLAEFIQESSQPPEISIECVMKSAGTIERMGRGLMKLRSDRSPNKEASNG